MDTEAITEIKDVLGTGELLKSSSQALTELMPGRKIVSAARAQRKVEEVLNDGIELLSRKAKDEGWPSDYLALRMQGFLESVGRQSSLESVVSFANKVLGEDEKVNQDSVDCIDSEWLNYFVYHSERTTSEDVQAIWGAILAGEINGEGAVTKRTMSILADMDKRDAAAWTELCSKCIGGTVPNREYAQPVPMLINVGEQFAMNPSDIDRLRGLGLIEFTLGFGFATVNTLMCQPAHFMQVGRDTLVIIGDGNAELEIMSRPFTPAGLQLARLCNLGNATKFEIGLIGYLKNLGFQVAKVSKWLDDGSVEYALLD